MEAARVAAERGHSVSLWEKGQKLGGNLIPGSAPEFKGNYRRLLDYLVLQLDKAGADITLGKEITIEQIEKLKPDVIFVATGSTPIIPNIVGVEKDNVVTAIDLLSGKKEPGDSVIVIGGGVVGCETALHLAQKGKEVTIVELQDNIGRDMYTVNRMHLVKLVSDSGIRLLTQSKVLEITDKGILFSHQNGRQESLEADTIVVSVGMKPRHDLAEKLSGQDLEVYAIGDCTEPRKLINAIREGYRIARCI